jgi:hypothetical protein
MRNFLKNFKRPSGELLLYVALCFGGSIYVALNLPTTAAKDQIVKTIVAGVLVIEGVLLLVRFRWSPEIYIGFFLFLLGWGLVRGVADGFTNARITMILGAVAALFAYPTLRREVRGGAATHEEQ